MELSSSLLSQFAKATKTESTKPDTGVQVEGTAKLYNNVIYVQLDGSDQLTPVISSTAGMKDGDRVTVLIKDHTAKVTGNVSSPSAGSDDLQEVKDDVTDQISEFEIIIADKADIEDLNAEKARIDDLIAENVTITGDLTAVNGKIDNLEADNVTINGKLTAAEGEIDDLKVTKLDAEIADLKFATIENLEATNANIHNLEADYGDFKDLATDKFTAIDADIENLETTKLSAEQADIKYAQIDFANIGKAAIENFFSKSGMIGDLVVGDGTITGTLVGVTIKGDLIEGGTVVADKLVIKGTDGLYYKLNTNGETVGSEQTEYNSLNGSIITAKSITAEKISVNDLVAFGATIGGFHITDSALYSGVKESIDNTTRGTYMDDTGQFAIGDQSNYLKFYLDSTDSKWKLELSANAIKFGASNKDLDSYIDDSVSDVTADVTTEYYLSTSATELAGGSWSATAPDWTPGNYIWWRTKTTKKNGSVSYSDPACLTGAPGEGTPGVGIESIVEFYAVSSSNSVPPESWSSTTVPAMTETNKYLWNYEQITYTDESIMNTQKRIIGVYGNKGDAGDDGRSVMSFTNYYLASSLSSGVTTGTAGWTTSPQTTDEIKKYLWNYEKIAYSDNTFETVDPHIIGTNGEKGADGTDGKDGTSVTVESTITDYQAGTSGTNPPTGSWTTGIPSVSAGQYLWTRIRVTFSDDTTTTSYSVARQGQNGAPGSDGADGTSVTVSSTATTYNVHTSGTSIPTDAWSSSIPSVPAGQYLWTRVITIYSDGKTATAYSVARQGQDGSDGQDGADGKGIRTTAVTYQAGTSGTTVPTGNWTASVPSVSAGRYLWTRTVITYTDGTSSTSYSVGRMGQNGAPGSAGADGKGIKSTVITYQAHSSQTSTPTGTWLSSIPALSPSKPYLWTRTVITYTDNATTTSYSVSSTLDGIEIGGRNCIINSSFSGLSDAGIFSFDGDVVTFTNDTLGMTSGISFPLNISDFLTNNARGKTITLSMDYFVEEGVTYGSTKPYVGAEVLLVRNSATGGSNQYFPWYGRTKFPSSVTDKWVRYSQTYDVSDYDIISGFVSFYFRDATGTVKYRHPKIELGNKATDWTPAPEDVDQNIQDAADSAIEQARSYTDTSIETTENSILSTVSTTYTSKEDSDNMLAQMTTQLEQTANEFNFNFSQMSQELDNLESTTGTKFNNIEKYIRFVDGDIILGEVDNPVTLRIENDRIAFLENNNEVMYITNEQLYIMRAIVANRLDIGGFAWVPRDNGNVSFQYNG